MVPFKLKALSRILMVCCAAVVATGDAVGSDALVDGFRQPPASAKPRVWWHWLNGNVSQAGIARDLAWMHSIGIGGVNVVDAAYQTPQVVDKRAVFMSADWQEAFRLAAKTASGYGMEFGVDSSPGWSETGGSWVKPEQAMKKLVWSTTVVEGGHRYNGLLPQPPSNAGPIQNVPIGYGGLSDAPKSQSVKFYRDSVVVAYRAVAEPLPATAISANGAIDGASLSDGDLTNGPTLIPPAGNKQAWLELAYARPVLMQGLTLAADATGVTGFGVEVSASDDRRTWRKIADINSVKLVQHTVSFAPTTARYLRLVFSPSPPSWLQSMAATFAPGADIAALLKRISGAPGPLAYHVHELVVHNGATVHEAEVKAGFSFAPDTYALATPVNVAPGSSVASADVRILSGLMRPDGSLDWTPPLGRWVLLRLGYSPTGQENRPASPEVTGLEVDKLDPVSVRDYMHAYLGIFQSTLGADGRAIPGLDALTVDSTEVGAQNWTDNILTEFRRLRGYDPAPWLPTLTGVVIATPVQSDKFLWDFRHTIAELSAQGHYGVIAEAAHGMGLTVYGEALEDFVATPSFGDEIDMRRYADIPMAAMWSYGRGQTAREVFISDITGAASVAHIYGRNLVAAESLTSAVQFWTQSPRDLKPIVDLEFALGVNRIVIHSSVHQPEERKPGIAMIVGQYFNRHETWAPQAKPWIDYIARSSYLLQQGTPVKDIAYFYGEDGPITSQFGDKSAEVPTGYGFDFVNAYTLAHQFTVADGSLVAKSGMRYRVLYLGGNSAHMTLAVLARLRDLVCDGLILVGRRPEGSPSLADDGAAFDALADELFGKSGEGGIRAVGRGHVVTGGSLADGLAAFGIKPDFTYTKSDDAKMLLALHRHLKDGELYFVSNRKERPEEVVASFRVSGLLPELWNAGTGAISSVSYRMTGKRTDVPLSLKANEAVFVVFHKLTKMPFQTIARPVENTLTTLSGGWQVAFPPNLGAPASASLPALRSWSENANDGVKYFSGQATYSKSFDLTALSKGKHLWLDLGDVHELADITLNGKHLGTLWNPPFQIDMSGAVRRGRNRLEICVTNLWVNRLIGDAQPGVGVKYTFTTIPTYKPDAPLRVSGLLGPVRIFERGPDGRTAIDQTSW